MKNIKKYPLKDWEPRFDSRVLEECVSDLESGAVLFFDQLQFALTEEEKAIFSDRLVDQKRKNISYQLSNDQMQGCIGTPNQLRIAQDMMRRFATYANRFVRGVLPDYDKGLELSRTSFRPVEIEGRQPASPRKDDTRLHIDAFPSTPTNGKRILRFFANVNLENKPRVWKVGESYEAVLKKFLPKAKKPFPGQLFLMHKLGITRDLRSLYDHLMLQVHDKMKEDEAYQSSVDQERVEFPAFTCWLVFTDQVSHAALAGQYVFEQTFYLPSHVQKFPERAPFAIMERLLTVTKK